MGADIRNGDRFRLTIEGTWDDSMGDFGVYVNDTTVQIDLSDDDTLTVEKIEPLVEVYGPGDVVRSKLTGNLHFIARGGCLLGKNWQPEGKVHTSEEYERVELVVRPF